MRIHYLALSSLVSKEDCLAESAPRFSFMVQDQNDALIRPTWSTEKELEKWSREKGRR